MNLESIEAIGGPAGGLLHDLGVVLVCAAVATLIFHQLRLPVIFGYLLTGMLLSPQLFEFSPIRDLGTIRELSELGVIFLLFYIGMEFDLRRLQSTIGLANILHGESGAAVCADSRVACHERVLPWGCSGHKFNYGDGAGASGAGAFKTSSRPIMHFYSAG